MTKGSVVKPTPLGCRANRNLSFDARGEIVSLCPRTPGYVKVKWRHLRTPQRLRLDWVEEAEGALE